MIPTAHSHKPGLGYALYPRGHALVSPRHLLLAIRRRSDDRLALIRVESVLRLGERVEDSFACIPVMHEDGHEVEVI